jgi:hypothetical protein
LAWAAPLADGAAEAAAVSQPVDSAVDMSAVVDRTAAADAARRLRVCKEVPF